MDSGIICCIILAVAIIATPIINNIFINVRIKKSWDMAGNLVEAIIDETMAKSKELYDNLLK